MKNNLIVIMLILAMLLMACGALTSFFSSQQNPKIFVGSIAMQGEGVLVICSDQSYGFTCTGKTTLVVSPSAHAFTLQTDNTGKIVSGSVKFNLRANQDYDFVAPDSPDCSGKLTGSSTSEYTGTIPLPAIGGPAATDAIFYGSLAQTANAQAPWHCPDAGGNPSGSIVQPQDNVPFELARFSSTMVQGNGGKCVFSVLDSASRLLTSYHPTCTYSIEEVTTLISSPPTRSP